jgi:hypothetical protein
MENPQPWCRVRSDRASKPQQNERPCRGDRASTQDSERRRFGCRGWGLEDAVIIGNTFAPNWFPPTPARTQRHPPVPGPLGLGSQMADLKSYNNHQSPDPSAPGSPINPASCPAVAPTGLRSMGMKDDGSIGTGIGFVVGTECSV